MRKSGISFSRMVLAAVLVGLLGYGLLQAARILAGRLGDAKSVQIERGYYYRLKVNLAYKGDPVAFDIVVGCNARVTVYADNDRSVEMGLAPWLYGLKMRDGAGVVVRPPNACRGETTANGKVPEGLMPFILVVEDADQPWFGLGYGTEDAYDSPLSVLRFGNATIEKVTRAEFEAWRRTEAPKNIVTPEMLTYNMGDPFHGRLWYPGKRYFPDSCRRVSRIRLPEPVREAVRRFWPDSRPAYWFSNAAKNAVWLLAGHPQATTVEGRGIPFDGRHFFDYFGYGTVSKGTPRRTKRGMFFYNSAPGEIYPERTDVSLNNLGPDGKLVPDARLAPMLVMGDAQIRPDLRGFMYCYPLTANDKGVPPLPLWLHQGVRVNGAPVAPDPDREEHYVGGVHYYYFERDEYMFVMDRFGLTGIFGGL